jgi:MurNAc alpha-1-phosphate uridylyltransferase
LQNGRLLEAGEQKLTFSGIGYYHPDLFADLEYGKRALAPVLREGMRVGKVSGERHSGVWLDIGTPERLSELDKSLL